MLDKARLTIGLGMVIAVLLAFFSLPRQGGRAEIPSAELTIPGVYVYYDWRNLDPDAYPWVKGSEISALWGAIESDEGAYDWSDFDDWIDEAASMGKGTVLKVPANDREYNGVPDYVFAAGVSKIWVGSYYYPQWWNPTFIDKYTTMIARFGQEYNGDPRVSAIAVSIGEYGEAEPGYGSVGWQSWARYWYRAGLTEDLWLDYSKKVIDAYVAAFPNKPLFVLEQTFPSGNTSGLWSLADYAASKSVNIGYNGLMADNSKADYWFTPFARFVEPGVVMGRLEQGPPKMSRNEVYWAVLNALRNHVHILSFYSGPAMDRGNEEAFNFANKYAGKNLKSTPGVWSALKETDPYAFEGHPGNFEFWLYQLDPEKTSVPLYGVGSDKKGVYARRTDQRTGRNNLTFNVDDGYIFDGLSHMVVTVTYFDSGKDSFELLYDAVDDPSKSAGVVYKTNTRTWKVATFEMDDARFANRLEGGDIRLYSRQDGDDTFHMVEASRQNP